MLQGVTWRQAINHFVHCHSGQAFGDLHRSLDLYMDDSNGKIKMCSCVTLWWGVVFREVREWRVFKKRLSLCLEKCSIMKHSSCNVQESGDEGICAYSYAG